MVCGDMYFSCNLLLREEGLRRGFAALDVEHTGKIPVDKFKRRLREVIYFILLNQIHHTKTNTNTQGEIPVDKFKSLFCDVTNAINDVNIDINIKKCAEENFGEKKVHFAECAIASYFYTFYFI